MPSDPARRRALKLSVFKKHAYKPTAPKVIAFLNHLYNQAARNTLSDRDKANVLKHVYLNKNNSVELQRWNARNIWEGKNLQFYREEKTMLDNLVVRGLDSLN